VTQTTAGVIAVVDDDASTRRSIKRLLEARGYTVSTFESAEEFLASALINSATGLILDIHLGGMPGICIAASLIGREIENCGRVHYGFRRRCDAHRGARDRLRRLSAKAIRR
jgi:FixJ family two-component response regulator